MIRAILYVLTLTLAVVPVAAQETGPMVGMTDAHNAVRNNINAGLPPVPGEPVQPVATPPLVGMAWANDLAAASQVWADMCNFSHDPNRGPVGENLYAAGPASPLNPPADVVNSWAGEASDYMYASHSCGAVCGHYTQLVWASTVEVGCAVAECPAGAIFSITSQFWVCRYRQAGNFIGVRPYCDGSGASCESGPEFMCNGMTATLVGTSGDDTLVGTPGADVIVGLGGDDIIKGKQGADHICGGDGNDLLRGGSGDDMIFGQGDNDVISAGAGADSVDGGPGNDQLYGGRDNDSLVGGPGSDQLDGAGGTDTCVTDAEDIVLPIAVNCEM